MTPRRSLVTFIFVKSGANAVFSAFPLPNYRANWRVLCESTCEIIEKCLEKNRRVILPWLGLAVGTHLYVWIIVDCNANGRSTMTVIDRAISFINDPGNKDYGLDYDVRFILSISLFMIHILYHCYLWSNRCPCQSQNVISQNVKTKNLNNFLAS